MITPAPEPPVVSYCFWSMDNEDMWHSDCGMLFEFNDSSPYGNGFHFCPKCGKPLVEFPADEPEEGIEP